MTVTWFDGIEAVSHNVDLRKRFIFLPNSPSHTSNWRRESEDLMLGILLGKGFGIFKETAMKDCQKQTRRPGPSPCFQLRRQQVGRVSGSVPGNPCSR